MRVSQLLVSGLVAIGMSSMLACGGSSIKSQPGVVTDVYAAGYENNGAGLAVAKYRKSGSPVVLTDGTHGANANSIFVSGNDIYVAGFEGNGTTDVAKYRKNGVPVVLTGGTKRGFTNSIFVSGADVYVAGAENALAEYWKNGLPLKLTDGTRSAPAWSIFVSGANVYVAGNENKTIQIGPNNSLVNPMAKYWKNG